MKKKRKYMARLTREGDFKRFKLLSIVGVNDRIPVRKCKKKDQKLKICIFCHGFFSKQLFFRHTKICGKGKGKGRSISKESNYVIASAQLPSNETEDDNGFVKNILSGMNDDLREICLKDPPIRRVGLLLYQPAKPRTFQNLRWKLRLLARLKCFLSQGKECSLAELLNVSNFDRMCAYVKNISNNEVEKKGSPTTAIVYGEIILDLMKSLESQAIREQDSSDCKVKTEGARLLEQIVAVRKVFDIEWKNKVKREARFRQKVKRIENEDVFPVAEDIKIFNEALTEEVTAAAESLQNSRTEANWKNLARALLVKITCFNARRPLEPGLITLKQFEKRKFGSEQETDFISYLTTSEKIIAKHMTIVKVVGKHARIVPVLLINQFVDHIKLLCESRDSCNVSAENPYVFAFGHESPMHAGRATKKMVEKCHEKYRLQRPDLITAKQFRRILGSSVQFLNLKDHEIENICHHLGHDMQTHLNHYRLHSDAAELAKVAKIRLLLDSGKLQEYAGKSLEDVEIRLEGSLIKFKTVTSFEQQVDCLLQFKFIFRPK